MQRTENKTTQTRPINPFAELKVIEALLKKSSKISKAKGDAARYRRQRDECGDLLLAEGIQPPYIKEEEARRLHQAEAQRALASPYNDPTATLEMIQLPKLRAWRVNMGCKVDPGQPGLKPTN